MVVVADGEREYAGKEHRQTESVPALSLYFIVSPNFSLEIRRSKLTFQVFIGHFLTNRSIHYYVT